MSSAPFSGCVFARTPLLLAEVVVCDNSDPEGWEEWPYRPHTPDSRPHHKKNVLCLSKGEIFRALEMRCAVTRKRGLMVINLSDQSVVSMLDVSAHMVLDCLCPSPMIKRDGYRPQQNSTMAFLARSGKNGGGLGIRRY